MNWRSQFFDETPKASEEIIKQDSDGVESHLVVALTQKLLGQITLFPQPLSSPLFVWQNCGLVLSLRITLEHDQS